MTTEIQVELEIRVQAYEVLIAKLEVLVFELARVGPKAALRSLKPGGVIYEQVKTLMAVKE